MGTKKMVIGSLLIYQLRGGSHDNGYFDNFDNKFLNKYKKNKIYRRVLLSVDWWSFKFHIILLLFDTSSKTVKIEAL
jgi:hypothetical protein